jgi:hypothetical protein
MRNQYKSRMNPVCHRATLFCGLGPDAPTAPTPMNLLQEKNLQASVLKEKNHKKSYVAVIFILVQPSNHCCSLL